MNLRQIEIFRAVMATGSTVDAARLLHVSQPGISRMIRHIESRIGVTLFERIRGRLVPTPEAQTLHAEIERVYRGVQRVQELAGQLRVGAPARLRLLASANVGLQLMPRAIARLLARYPQATVTFESLSTGELLQRLVAEEAELAVSSAPLEHPSLAVREIGAWTMLCAVPRGHPLSRARTFRLADALREPQIAYSAQAPQSRVIDDWLAEHRIARRAVVEVRSGYAACAMAAAGIGVAFVDDLSARAHRGEALSFLRVPRAPSFPIYSITNRHRPPSLPGRAFLALAQAELRLLQAAAPG